MDWFLCICFIEKIVFVVKNSFRSIYFYNNSNSYYLNQITNLLYVFV